MKILAFETSAGPASCAVIDDGKVLALSYVNTPLTHSQTLMPMAEALLKHSGLALDQMDRLAVSAGPGSFTGIRIGISAVKGLAFANHIPCVGVSTLAAIARNGAGIPFDGVICSVMDARCSQVYTACFAGGSLERITPDEAISVDELKNRLISYKKSVLLLGDGAELCYNTLREKVPGLILAAPDRRYQTAAGVAAVALTADPVSHEALQPVYLRLPQAERELRAKMQKDII